MAQHAPHTTTIEYELDPATVTRYINLDSVHDAATAIAEVSDHHLVHCRWEAPTAAGAANAYILGSDRGAWARLPHVVAQQQQQQQQHGGGDHALLVRKVTGARADATRPGCTHLTTVTVHPWELFATVSIVAQGSSPYTHTYRFDGTNPVAAAGHGDQPTRRRAAATTNAAPAQAAAAAQAPQACDESAGGSCAFRVGGVAPAFMFNTKDGKTSTMANAHLGAELHHDTNNGGLSVDYHTSLRGVVCTSCFAYVGAGFELSVQYSRDAGVTAEMVSTGGSGFNIDVEFRDAALDGSYNFPAYSPQTDEHWVNVDVGKTAGLPAGALTLGHKLGGLMIEVTGQGRTSEGPLSVHASSQGANDATTAYTNQAGTGGGDLSATVILSATTNFKVALNLSPDVEASAPAEFLFDANIAGNVTVVTERPRDFAATVTVSRGEPKEGLHTAATTAAAHDALTFRPGDVMDIEVAFAGVTSHALVLFYSLAVDGGEEIPVKRERLAEPGTQGVHTVSWTVPWDMRLVGDGVANAVLYVRSSADVTRPVATRAFGLRMYTEDDGIFVAPAANEIVPVGTPYALRWHAHLLETYEPLFYGAQGGSTRRTTHCHFTLVAEVLAADGAVARSVSVDVTPYLVAGTDGVHLGNNGLAHVAFPAHVAGLGDRFYLWVHSSKHLHVSGWSSGYFTLRGGEGGASAAPMGPVGALPEWRGLTTTNAVAAAAAMTTGGKRSRSTFLPAAAAVAAGGKQAEPSIVSRYVPLSHSVMRVGAGGSTAVVASSVMVGGSGVLAAAGASSINGGRAITAMSFSSPAKTITRVSSASRARRLASLTDPPAWEWRVELAALWLACLAYRGPGQTTNIVPGDFTWPGYDFGGVGFATFTGLGDFKTAGELQADGLDLFGVVGTSDNNKAIYVAFRGVVATSLPNWMTDTTDSSTVAYCGIADGCFDDFSICKNNAPAGSSGYKQVTVSTRVNSVYCWSVGLADPACVTTQSSWTWGTCYASVSFAKYYQKTLRKWVRQLVASVVPTYPTYSIVVCGHGVGAALATLAAADLVQNYANPVKLMNFESPRLLGPDASVYVSVQLTTVYRVTHCQDPVVQMPFQSWGYQHVVGEIFHQCMPGGTTWDYSKQGTLVLGGFENPAGSLSMFNAIFRSVNATTPPVTASARWIHAQALVPKSSGTKVTTTTSPSSMVGSTGVTMTTSTMMTMMAQMTSTTADHSMNSLAPFVAQSSGTTTNPLFMAKGSGSLLASTAPTRLPTQPPTFVPTATPTTAAPTTQMPTYAPNMPTPAPLPPTPAPIAPTPAPIAPTPAPVTPSPTVPAPTRSPTTTYGYVIVSAVFPPSDTQCLTSPLRTTLRPLGACSTVANGGSPTSYAFTADPSNALVYSTTYPNPTCTNPSSYTSAPYATSTCSCSATQCEVDWLYSPNGLAGFLGSYQVYTYYNDPKCTTPAYLITANAVPQAASSCTPAACATGPDGNGFTVTCIGFAPTPSPTVGIITTGYINALSFPSSDTTCSTAATAQYTYKVGACMPYNATAGTILTADTTGALYQSVYSSRTCQGQKALSGNAPMLQTCTCQAGGCWLFSYSSVPPASAKTTTVQTMYSGGSCTTGTEYMYYSTFGAVACTPGPCTTSGTQSSAVTCAGVASSAVPTATVTTGYALLTATFAPTDTKCQQPPSVGIFAPLGRCIVAPSSTSQTASTSYIYSADTNGNVYYTFYGNTACTGVATGFYTTPAQGCTCTATSCVTTYAYYTALPTYSATTYLLTATTYASAGCTGTPISYSYSVGGTCVPSACTSTTAGGTTVSNTVTCVTTPKPTAAPTIPPPTVVVSVQEQYTLGGITAAQFQANKPLQVAFLNAIANAGGIDPTALSIVSSARRRQMLQTNKVSVIVAAVLNSATWTPAQLEAALCSPAVQASLLAALFSYGIVTVNAAVVRTAATAPPASTPLSAANSLATSSAGCFAGTELLTLENGATKALSEVAVGDRVLTVNGKTGEQVYSDIVYLPHGKNTARTTFTVLATEAGRDLKMTANHVLPAGACTSPTTAWPAVAASTVAAGECVETVSGRERVVSVSTVQGEGIYTAIAMEELLVVNGIVATPYGGVNPTLANVYYNLHRCMYLAVGAGAMKQWVQAATEGLWALFSA